MVNPLFFTALNEPNRNFSEETLKTNLFNFRSFLSNLKCALKDNRGNSSILIGPRASGKSSLIKQLVKETIEENCQTHQIETFTLQGLIFPETNSVLKFLLSKFRSLLNISETSEETEEDVSEFMAFDQLTALVKQFFAPNLKVTKKKFIIFILEDLERFAAHPQQNLLYCLFELALSLPVFVVGTSCRIDVLELLEKRVKSRFSQNIVYLPLPSSKEEFIERITANLLVKDSTLYNESLTKNFIETNGLFGNLGNFHFEFTKDVRPIFRLLTRVYSSIPKDETFDWNKFSELFESIHGPVRPEIPLNSSILETTLVELMIVVSMCRLAAKFPSTPVTFDVMMEELSSCKQRASNLEHFCWLKSTIQVAFDRLINCRLLLLTSNSVNYGGANSSWTDRSYLTVRLGLPIFVILDSIERHQMMSKEIFALACEKF